eukprot:CAMPEP_0180305762 /NCGR_PEP_ID=MMETSP0988-20121125/26592_1 /TAXON_ID=697907 /ORGANISM="non described non described, Strain CCMP2293" /LENGTH=353 /DNA_ID=CAMNT_0022288203 /DNA_START=23 /DNA_END=1080 /DNA_ORIENTATION=-
MPYDYLLVVDFQVTSGSKVGKHEEEVFEFPWVVFDVESKQVVDEKQVFVKTETHPELPAGPAETRESVQAGGTLQEAVKEFNDYVHRSFEANDKAFCVLSLGEAPLKRWLRVDAKNKNVELDDKYSTFMDLATEFKKTYPRLAGSSSSLRKMADALDVTIDTEAARGLPFCKQVAHVLCKMAEDGAKFDSTVSIPEDFNPMKPDEEQDASSPKETRGRSTSPRSRAARGRRGGASQSRSRERSRSKSGGSTDRAKECVVRCRGLPFNATDRDVKEFFAGLSVEWEGVVLSIGADGRPNGEAFVKFEESGDVTKALARDRQKMERRYVEVFLGKESDMKEALKDVERSKKGDRG